MTAPWARLKADKPTLVLLAVLGMVVAFAAGQYVYITTRPAVDHVLRYPEQRVMNRLIGTDRPAALISDDLKVQATKCNEGDDPVKLSGRTVWVSVDPPGSTVRAGEGAGERPPGCLTSTYENPIPDEVIRRTRELVRDGQRQYVTWRVAGTETPDDPLLAPATWQTEKFDLYVTAP